MPEDGPSGVTMGEAALPIIRTVDDFLAWDGSKKRVMASPRAASREAGPCAASSARGQRWPLPTLGIELPPTDLRTGADLNLLKA